VNASGRLGRTLDSRPPAVQKEKNMLWTLFVILVVLWLLGFSFHVAGGFIHLLLVLAVVVLIFNLLAGRRTDF